MDDSSRRSMGSLLLLLSNCELGCDFAVFTTDLDSSRPAYGHASGGDWYSA